jgi:hypothetical protein
VEKGRKKSEEPFFVFWHPRKNQQKITVNVELGICSGSLWTTCTFGAPQFKAARTVFPVRKTFTMIAT